MTESYEHRARSALRELLTVKREDALRRARALVEELATPSTHDEIMGVNLARVVIATEHLLRGQFDEPLVLAEQIRADGERHAIRELRARGIRTLARRERYMGRLSTSLRFCDEALYDAAQCNQPALVGGLILDKAEGLVSLQGYSEAQQLVDDASELFARPELEMFVCDTALVLAQITLGLGDPKSAQAYLNTALQPDVHGGLSENRVYAAVIEARVARALGRHKSRRFLDEFYERAKTLNYDDACGPLLSQIAWQQLEVEGDTAGAIRSFEQCVEWPFERADSEQWVEAQLALADAYASQQDHERSRATLASVLAHMEQQREANTLEIRGVLALGRDLLQQRRDAAASDSQGALVDGALAQLHEVNFSLRNHVTMAMSDIRGPLAELQLVAREFSTSPAEAVDTQELGRAAEELVGIVDALGRLLPPDRPRAPALSDVVQDALMGLRRSAAARHCSLVFRHQTNALCPTRVAFLQRLLHRMLECVLDGTAKEGAFVLLAFEEQDDLIIEIRQERHEQPPASFGVAGRESGGSEYPGWVVAQRLATASGAGLSTACCDGDCVIRARWPALLSAQEAASYAGLESGWGDG